MTVEDVIRWFTENPNGTVSEFCKVFAGDVVFSTVNNPQKGRVRHVVHSSEKSEIEMNEGHLSTYLVGALWKINTPETQQIIKQLLNNTDNHNNILASFYREIDHEFVQFRMAKTGDVNDYLTFRDISEELPDFIFDILEIKNTENSPQGIMFIKKETTWSPILALCLSPRAGQILEKWANAEEDNKQKQIYLRDLEIWRKRKEIQEQNKELFHKLVEGKILPDDLLVPLAPWVWKDGQYVQEVQGL
jgi:hypothetical protein